jgi:threonyl-tRNA synthetase
MSIYKDVQTTEVELFNILELAFKYAANREFPKLKVCMEALFELEKDYKEMTKTNFIKIENVERLLTELDKLEKEYNANPYKTK